MFNWKMPQNILGYIYTPLFGFYPYVIDYRREKPKDTS